MELGSGAGSGAGSGVGSGAGPWSQPRLMRNLVPNVPQEHPGTTEHLGADDFLPIFIYVLMNSKICELSYLSTLLCNLCDPDKRLSETGYYLATFEAAVEHIKQMDIEEH